MGQHAIRSPSGAERWATCIGSVAMEHGRPPSSSEYADEGTAAHFIYNLCLEHGHDASYFLDREVAIINDPVADFDGAVFNDAALHKGSLVRQVFTIDAKMVDLIQTAVENTRLGLEGAAMSWFEVDVPLEGITGERATGQADVLAILDDGTLCVDDLKFGRREVPPDCRQLRMYALAAIDKLDMVYGPFTGVRLTIHQPKIHDKPLAVRLTLEELEKSREELRDAAERSEHAFEFRENWLGKSTEYLTPSEDACRYCRAAGDCQAQDEAVQAAIMANFSDVSAVTEAAVTVAKLDITTLAEKLALVPMVEAWCESVKAQGYGRAMAGEKLPGMKLVLGRRGNRVWSNPEEAEAALKTMRLKQEEMYSFKLKTPPAIEQIFGPKGSAPSTKRWNKLVAMISQAEGKPSLVPADDSRPEYVVKKTTPDDFEDVSQGASFNAEDMV